MKYLIKYEAPPISEVVKTKVIEAESLDMAMKALLSNTDNVKRYLA